MIQPPRRRSGWLVGPALGLCFFIMLAIVTGVLAWHLPPDADVGWYPVWLWLHVILTGLGILAAVWVRVALGRADPPKSPIVRRANWLLILLLATGLTGAGDWVSHYGIPCWLTDRWGGIHFVPTAGGAWQAATTAGHTVLGVLALSISLSVAVRICRLVGSPGP